MNVYELAEVIVVVFYTGLIWCQSWLGACRFNSWIKVQMCPMISMN